MACVKHRIHYENQFWYHLTAETIIILAINTQKYYYEKAEMLISPFASCQK